MTTKEPKSEPNTNAPDFIAYCVIERDGEERKAVWRAIGSAWTHDDGRGIQLHLDASPIGGVVTLRKPL